MFDYCRIELYGRRRIEKGSELKKEVGAGMDIWESDRRGMWSGALLLLFTLHI